MSKNINFPLATDPKKVGVFRELLGLAVRLYDPEEIIIFGSHALIRMVGLPLFAAKVDYQLFAVGFLARFTSIHSHESRINSATR